MSLQPHPFELVPEETARVAHAAYPKGNLYLSLHDHLGAIYKDEQFTGLFPKSDNQPMPRGDWP